MGAKTIKPRKLRISQTKSAIKDGFSRTINSTKAVFSLTYQGWERGNIPKWDLSSLEEVNGNLQQEYSTESKIYNIVQAGSPPHTIKAKPGGFMRFRDGFKAKTTPGVLTSFSQPPPMGDWHTKQEVNHPGFEGRESPKLVLEQIEPIFVRNMNDAVKVM